MSLARLSVPMFTTKFRNLVVAVVFQSVLFTTLLPVANAQKPKAPVEATPPPVNEEFKFGEVDLEVLEQSELLDQKLERDGLILADASANDYLSPVSYTHLTLPTSDLV